MLIRNDQEREKANLPPLSFVCGGCQEELQAHYPVVFIGDRNNTGYHLVCAAQLASEIADTIADYLSEISAESKVSAMTKAFREARKTKESGS